MSTPVGPRPGPKDGPHEGGLSPEEFRRLAKEGAEIIAELKSQGYRIVKGRPGGQYHTLGGWHFDAIIVQEEL